MTFFRRLLTDAEAMNRRQLIGLARNIAAVAIASPLTSRIAWAHQFSENPFTLGVASGDPVADGFVLWTRLAPDPLTGGGAGADSIPVAYEVARDPRFLNIVARGQTLAAPELGHSVHVNVASLDPDRWYYYRFIAGGAASPIGRTRTFPAIGSTKDRFRFAFASCQHYMQGHFTAYNAMMDDDLDLIIHLGDYIYESNWGPKVRFHPAEPETLDQYRYTHAIYKSDPALQAAHAWHPFLVTWDDHELDNDYAGADGEDRPDKVAFIKRRAAAYQAYYENMPLRPSAQPIGPDMTLYTASHFGNLAHISMLDTRQYRSDQACQGPEKFGGQIVENCAEREAAGRTMLGPDQERWLKGQLARSPAVWKIIGQQLLMAQLDQKAGAGQGWWSDGWDGYPAGRGRILGHIAERKIENVVVIGGDIHSFWVTDLKADFNAAASPVIATEFVGTSVTSAGVDFEMFSKFLPDNPHIKYFESRQRGYAKVEITPQRWQTEFRAMSTVTEPAATVTTLKRYIVEAGKPGANEG